MQEGIVTSIAADKQMSCNPRRPHSLFALIALSLAIGPSMVVADTAGASADPVPGFGVLIAVTAIIVAITIAVRKRRIYESESP